MRVPKIARSRYTPSRDSLENPIQNSTETTRSIQKTGTAYRIPNPLRNALQRPPVMQSRQISIPASRHSFWSGIPLCPSSCSIRQVILPTASLSSCSGSCSFFIASHLPDCSFCIYFPKLPVGSRLCYTAASALFQASLAEPYFSRQLAFDSAFPSAPAPLLWL